MSHSGLVRGNAGRPDYGIDAPGVRHGMAAVGIGGAVLAVVAATASGSAGRPSVVWASIAGLACLPAVYGLGMASYMTYCSRVGKLRTRERLLDLAARLRPWTGREHVLDVGCGRGLMLIGAAKRLTSGTALGIDLWRAEDQAGNRREATLANAEVEGVADRVAVETGDARALPYSDASFDAVLSHWVVHNLPTAADRTQALDEMVRVLRPGGVLVLADIAHLDDYRMRLQSKGLGASTFVDGGASARLLGLLSGGTFKPQAIVGLRRS